MQDPKPNSSKRCALRANSERHPDFIWGLRPQPPLAFEVPSQSTGQTGTVKHLQQGKIRQKIGLMMTIPTITLNPMHYDLIVRGLAQTKEAQEYFALEQLFPAARDWQREVELGLARGRITICGVPLRRQSFAAWERGLMHS